MTHEEKAALEFLDGCAGPWKEHIATLKAMLARPVLPEIPTQAALYAMGQAWLDGKPNEDCWPYVYRALYAHLTAPKTKEVEVWRFEWAYDGVAGCFQAHDTAEAALADLKGSLGNKHYSDRRVTGPHKQTVPAS
jgi:hypothetical protein